VQLILEILEMAESTGWEADEGSVALGMVVGLIRGQLDAGTLSREQARAIVHFAMPQEEGVNFGKSMAKVREHLPELFGSSQAQRI
jgi:hypothetical protein